ncbi:DNA topoisomerase III [Paenisporosarcina cavernae]|uniref:DNA topoisomerase 3 n=1 Tax=Paenisporosarcina cavernae TaxID=2320858 RepID=A0A385YPU8_9BACL|nr:DNA topoisomerase III [Paenisporosarcina cavernae]AYC28755.1 DNA topoisomerase III [Paenisporosarcina cavernae]
MSKSVVLAEKPSVARDIARVLGCTKKGNGFLEGPQYIVTWALGHLVTHADPEGYKQEYKEWNLDTLPILPNPFKLVPIKQTMKQFQAVKTLLHRNDVNEIIIATDAGREGELVARWILEKTNVKKPVKRLWISSVTDKAIQQGFRQLKPGKAYENLFQSAVARAEADWIVGINATRALTVKYNAQLSAGRVQTPTLFMIAERERQIQAFNPKTYYGLEASIEGTTYTWVSHDNQKSVFDEKKVDDVFHHVQAIQTATVTSVQTKEKKQLAPPLFDLTELQKEGHRRFGWSAKETLSALQGLYERHKIVTYPRTDSKHLSSDMKSTLIERVKAVDLSDYRTLTTPLLRAETLNVQKGVIDDAKVSDHHAIIPTEEAARWSELSDKERKLYDLIVRRFLAVLMAPYVYDETQLTLTVGKETFQTKGKSIREIGWKAALGKADEELRTSLPKATKGQVMDVSHVRKTSGETKPPARFNEGTLLAAMENPAAFMKGENPELIQQAVESGGLGTVATRADIIEKLFSSFVVEKKGQDIFTTSKGRQLLSLVPEALTSPALTGEWELKLSQIANGKLSKETFMKPMVGFTQEIVREIKSSDAKFKHDNVTGKTCPECGKALLEVNGKRGKMLVCQDRSCGYKKNIAMQTNARCTVCHKRMELRGEGDGRIFTCSCGHREKLSVFEKRKNQSGSSKAGKKDVQKYLKKQEEPQNTAMAEALKKMLGQNES